VRRVDVRGLGLAVVALGGGRRQPGAAIDPRVGLTHCAAPGQAVAAGAPLARVHAASADSAAEAAHAVAAAFDIDEGLAAPPRVAAAGESPVVLSVVGADGASTAWTG
jgi:thymidine phosphorylase